MNWICFSFFKHNSFHKIQQNMLFRGERMWRPSDNAMPITFFHSSGIGESRTYSSGSSGNIGGDLGERGVLDFIPWEIGEWKKRQGPRETGSSGFPVASLILNHLSFWSKTVVRLPRPKVSGSGIFSFSSSSLSASLRKIAIFFIFFLLGVRRVAGPLSLTRAVSPINNATSLPKISNLKF